MKSAGRKAFIADAIVDIWAIFIFVIVIIVFAVIYRWSADAAMQRIQDKMDITYGNYLAQVYLRTPIVVAGDQMTVAELIALYDYNQTLEKEQGSESWFEAFSLNPFSFLTGTRNPMADALNSITDDFVYENFDEGRCCVFVIEGREFEYAVYGSGCVEVGFFSVDSMLDRLPGLPKSSYVTYVAPVDPRDPPIMILSVYDLKRLSEVYH